MEEVQEEFQRIKSELETANSTISSLKQQIQTLKAQFATPAVQVKATIEKRGFLEDDLRIEVRNITNRTLENVKILVISLDKNGEVMFSPFGFENEERIPLIYPGERAIVSVTPVTIAVSFAR